MSLEFLAIAAGYEDRFLTAEKNMMEMLGRMENKEDSEEEPSELLQIHEGVGVVEIRGMLTNVNSRINKYFGLVAYDEIRKASIQAVEAGVGGIMYHISSSGGRVAGMNGAAELISSLSVPTLAYAEETMASAALFLGIQADDVYAGDFAQIGSVGVIAQTMDYTEAMKKAGVKAIRFRSGDLKQAGNPMFKLSEKEHKYMMDQTMTYAGKFFDIVSQARGIPRPILDSTDSTSGRTFIGQEALQVGLVDRITTFDAAFMKIAEEAKKNIDSRKVRTVF